MAEGDAAEAEGEDAPKKKGMLMPLVIGLVLAAAGGGGGFFAASSGMLGGGEAPEEKQEEMAETEEGLPDPEISNIAFVPIEPIFVGLGNSVAANTLRFRAELEVTSSHTEEVTGILPRIVDVLNGYLRAIDPAELEEPTALIRLRAQMLRRIQVVAGAGRVRDLLIMEFVLN